MTRVLEAAATIVWVLGGLGLVLAVVRPPASDSRPYWRRPWIVVASFVGLAVVVAADLAS
jgi:hypothetical protein